MTWIRMLNNFSLVNTIGLLKKLEKKKKPTLPTQNGRMGSESIAHDAFGLMGYLLSGHEGERNNCSSKIQLVAQKYRE